MDRYTLKAKNRPPPTVAPITGAVGIFKSPPIRLEDPDDLNRAVPGESKSPETRLSNQREIELRGIS